LPEQSLVVAGWALDYCFFRVPFRPIAWPLAIIAGWFGISHLVAAFAAYPDCPELGAIAEYPQAFEPLLDSDEAAALLKIHPKTLQRMARRGDIPATNRQTLALPCFGIERMDARYNRAQLSMSPQLGKETRMRRATYQRGCLRSITRKNGTIVWEYRWRELQHDGIVKRRAVIFGTLEDYPTESSAQAAADALRLTINHRSSQHLLREVSVEKLVNHYRQHELPLIFCKGKGSPSDDEQRKSYDT
jgi:hypothetical protein